MTTLKEISDKLNVPPDEDFFPNMWDIDIGDYEFTGTRRIDEFLLLYENEKNPKIKLLFNDDGQAAVLYQLNDDDTVNVTIWRLGIKMSKTYDKEDINEEIFNN